MKMETTEEYEEKKAWIEDYIQRWEKHRGPDHVLTDEDKETARKSLMTSVQLH